MAQPVLTLLAVNLRAWLSGRGFVMVAAAAFFPLVLTGAWVGTHQGDVSAVEVTWTPAEAIEGQNVTFHAVIRNTGGATVGPFNASLSVGQVFGNTLRAEGTNTTTIPGLAPGESYTQDLTWTARAGVYWALAFADNDDTLGEVEEFNNQKPVPLLVKYAVPAADAAPPGATNLGGDPNATAVVDLAVGAPSWSGTPGPGEPVTLRATVTNRGAAAVSNATAVLRVARGLSGQMFPVQESTQSLDLGPGQSQDLEVTWTSAQAGAFWAEATVAAPPDTRDAAPGDNRQVQPLVVQPVLPADLTPPPQDPKATIKDFYGLILSVLHLRLLVPLIALFYAAGVLADEKERGNLVYVLTRPVERWTIPLAKFLAGYAVAAVAIVLGIVGTYLLLFGFASQGDIGFLTTPLLASLIALLAYGALFILLGVLVERPYLIGVAFVLGWETAASLFVPWVDNLTVHHYIQNMLCVPDANGLCASKWPLDQGVQLLPQGAGAVGALQLVLVASVVFLALSAWAMRRKEFPE